MCKSEDNPIRNEVAMDRTRSNMGFFGSQGQVIPKWINSLIWLKFEYIREFSCLPATLMTIRSKLKALSIGQGQIWAFLTLKGK